MSTVSTVIMAEKCLICDEAVENDLCNVREKGIVGLCKASELRKDSKGEVFRNKTSGVVHNSCRRDYVRSDSIKRFLKEAILDQPSTSRDASSLRFFCTQTYDEEKESKKPYAKRQTVFNVRTTTFLDSIIVHGQKRNDEWGNDVVRRICTVGDLHAADAIYHNDCYKKFLLTVKPSKRKVGRPPGEGIQEAMEEIYEYIDGNDKCQFSIDELLKQVTGEPPHVKTIKERMMGKYGDRIVFSTIRIRKTVVSFRTSSDRILSDSWYTSRSKDELGECERVVRKAAEIILDDVETMAYDNGFYPPSHTFCDEAEDLIPQSLKVFLNGIAKKKR